MLLRAILCGGVWKGFLLGKVKKEDVPCRFCGQSDGDGHLFWECTFPPLQHARELLEFSSPMSFDRRRWSRCLLWHGWLPGLTSAGVRDPWAASLGQLTEDPTSGSLLIFGMLRTWPTELGDHPCVTEGSRENCPTGGFEVASAGVCLLASGLAMQGAI